MAKVAVIILNWNGWQDTIQCLESLKKVEGSKLDVILVENGSCDDSKVQLLAYLKDHDLGYSIHFLESQANLGFAGGVNLGADKALGIGVDFVYLLNNDAQVMEGTISQAIAVAQQADVPLVGSVTRDPKTKDVLFLGRDWPKHMFGRRKARASDSENPWRQTAYVEGSGALIRESWLREVIADRGFLLDPALFLYCEDVDLGSYLLKKGQWPLMALKSEIYHETSKSGGGLGNSLAYYYITRNRVRLANRWLSGPQKLAFHIYYISTRILLMVGRSCLGQRTTVLAYWEGLKDAYLGRSGQWRRHPG